MKIWKATAEGDVLDERGNSILECDDPYCGVSFKYKAVAEMVAALPAVELALRTVLECETLEQAKANAEVGIRFLEGKVRNET